MTFGDVIVGAFAAALGGKREARRRGGANNQEIAALKWEAESWLLATRNGSMSQVGRGGQEIEAGENLAAITDNVDLAGTFLRIAHSWR